MARIYGYAVSVGGKLTLTGDQAKQLTEAVLRDQQAMSERVAHDMMKRLVADAKQTP